MVVFRRIAWGLSLIVLLILSASLIIIIKILESKLNSPNLESLTLPTLLTVATLPIFYLLSQLWIDLNNALGFDKYKEKTIAKLVKLGGNPEDLDKEEEG